MTVLNLVLVLVGLLVALNLVLTVGLIRRIRDHTQQLARLSAPTVTEVALPAGAVVKDFSTTSIDGRQVDSHELVQTLVGVFSPHCSACEASLPQFTERAAEPASLPFLAVVAARDGDADALVARMPPTATVVVEPDGGPVQQALGVTGYPAFLLLERGVVQVSSYDLDVVLDKTVPAA